MKPLPVPLSATLLIAFMLLLTASGSLMAQLGPMLRVEADPTNFDTTLCGTTKCRQITFRNVGDALLTVQSIQNLSFPFSGAFSAPFQLAPGQGRSFEACYSPTTAPVIDSQRVTVEANGRVPLSIAMIFDTSGSMSINDFMDMQTGETIRRIDAANRAGRQFVSKLVDTLGIRDEAAIFRYSSGSAPTFGFFQKTSFTSNRGDLIAAIPTSIGGGTCTFQAVRQTLEQIRTRNIAGRRVIVLLSDGDDGNCGGLTLSTLLAEAVNPDPVRIFTIGIGNGITANGRQSLQNLADGTGGRFFSATTVQGLLAVYDSIATLLSQNVQSQSFSVRGRAVAPVMVVNPASVDFDSVRVGTSRCLPVTITNTGDAPLVVSNVSGLTPPFSMQIPAIPTIEPGASTTVDFCFTPERLRVQSGNITFAYNSCTSPQEQLALRGVGYDSVAIALIDSFTAKPGSMIQVPVYLRGTIPASYEVGELRFAVAFNKTMLFPADQPFVTDGTLSSVMPIGTHLREFGDSTLVVTYTLRGGTLVNPAPEGILVRLNFLVLHGNAMVTPIRLIEASLADGNPKTGLVTPGRFTADSICYQEQRLIDASERIGGVIRKVALLGADPVAMVSYQVMTPATVRLGLYDATGREIERAVDGWRENGEFEAAINTAELPNGIYFLRLTANGVSDVKPMSITR
jgi:hypothetical protein